MWAAGPGAVDLFKVSFLNILNMFRCDDRSLTCVVITLVFAGGAFMRSAGPGATYFGEIDLPLDLYHLKILETYCLFVFS